MDPDPRIHTSNGPDSDPDPAIFVSDLQHVNKIFFFLISGNGIKCFYSLIKSKYY
jgi:hypothetical protein